MSLLDTYIKLQSIQQQREQAAMNQLSTAFQFMTMVQKMKEYQNAEALRTDLSGLKPYTETYIPLAGMTGGEEYDIPNPETGLTKRTNLSLPEQYRNVASVYQKHGSPEAIKYFKEAGDIEKEERTAKQKKILGSGGTSGIYAIDPETLTSTTIVEPTEKEGKIPQSVAGAWIQGRAKELMTQGIEENTALKQASDEARAKGFDEKQTLINIRQDQGPSAASNRHVSTSLRKEFNGLGPVKEYREVENKFNVMDKAFAESKKTGNFVAVDQALITLYNKMTDPASVVRESEYVRTPQDMAVMNRVKAAVARVGKGGRLEPDTRQALMTMATKFKEVYTGKYIELADEYRDYARGYGVDPEMVVSKKATDRASKTIAQPEPSSTVVPRKPNESIADYLKRTRK